MIKTSFYVLIDADGNWCVAETHNDLAEAYDRRFGVALQGGETVLHINLETPDPKPVAVNVTVPSLAPPVIANVTVE